MKKIVFVIIAICLVFSLTKTNYAYAEQQSVEEIEQELDENIDDQLNNIDFGELDNIFNNLDEEAKGLFNSTSFYDKVMAVLNGELSTDSSSFFQYIFNLFFDNLLKFVPLLALIAVVSILCSFVGQLSPTGKTSSINNVVYFACFGIIIVLLSTTLKDVITNSSNTILSIQKQMEVIFPILLVMLTSVGGVSTSATMQPMVGILSSGVIYLFNAFVLPIFVFSVIFTIVGNLSNEVKLDKFNKFFSSLFKWVIGGIFTIFLAIIAIKGLTASSIDGISIKTAKFALKTYIPILGGYLSDGFNLILVSSMLIKNAVGGVGLLLFLLTIIAPIVNLVVLSLGLKLVAAIVEPISDNKIPNFIYSVANLLTMLIVCLIAVAFMYLIVVGLFMLSGNIL